MTDQAIPDEDDQLHGAEPPNPVGRALIISFVVLLFLIFNTQGLAIYSSGNLSTTLAEYAEGEGAIRNLGMALLELEAAVHVERDWLVSGDSTRFDPFRFSARIRAAEEILTQVQRVPKEYRGIHEAVGAALEDARTRHMAVQQAMMEGHLDTARRIGADRRALEEAFETLGNALQESRHNAEELKQEAIRQSHTLDLSLTVITVSMIISAALLAYLWKRLVELH